MDQRNRLSILAQEVAAIHIDESELRAVILHLHRHGEHVISATKIDRYLESRADLLRNLRRSQLQADGSPSVGLLLHLLQRILRSRGRSLAWHRSLLVCNRSRRWRMHSRNGRRDTPHLHRVLRAGVYSFRVQRIDLFSAHHMRNYKEHNFVILRRPRLRAKDVPQDRQFRESRRAAQRTALLLHKDATQNAGLAFPQPDRLVYGPLRDDRLINPAQVHRTVRVRDLDLHLDRHIAVIVHRRLHIYIDAHIQVLELGVDQRADNCGGCASLYEPVATGYFWPILSTACCPSEARTRGFCNTRVSESVSSRFACACPIVTAKFVAFRCARSFSVRLPVVVGLLGVVGFEELDEEELEL